MSTLRRWWTAAQRTRLHGAWKRYSDSRGNVLAGGVGYFAFFSIFPAVLLAFTVFGLLLRDQPQLLEEAKNTVDELKERYANVVVQDKGKRYNTDLLEAIELGFLIELAEVITLGALARKESRGGHFREDYEARDDVNFMRHTMAYRAPVTDVDNGPRFADEVRLDYKPVTVTRYQPMERKY